MKRASLALLAFALILGTILIASTITRKSRETPALAVLRAKYSEPHKKSVDHSKFPQLQRAFAAPQEITAACIGCHNERHKEVMASSHWNWGREEYVAGKGIRFVGKKNILNNFCIGIQTNEESCNKCHTGYGWRDDKFNFNDPRNVDCLACHDNSNTYVKASGGAGMPDPSVNLNVVAQSVGRPERANCGTCHFFGGGGNNVKHGDLDSSLFDPSRAVDVHMASEGANLQCVDCHVTENHKMKGKVYSLSSMNRDRSTCESCHTETPHESDVINEHTLKVACQSCHIPVYAKVNPTKLSWDWSTAGKLKDGKPYTEHAEDGTDSYMSIKGSFTWGKEIEPEYVWFNGTASHYLVGDKIDPDSVVKVNELHGSYDDPDAKIIPVKIHRGNQIYDKEHLYLIQPKTYSGHSGDGGFWKEFNWNRAAELGMKDIGLPYSGQYGFVKTEMYWPINHMVSTKEKTVNCTECHTRDNSRLQHLTDFYLPGRDRSTPVEFLGKLMVFLTLAGVLLHGAVRIVVAKRHEREKGDRS